MALLEKIWSDKKSENDPDLVRRYKEYYFPDLNAILFAASLIISYITIIVGYFCDPQSSFYHWYMLIAVIAMLIVIGVTMKILDKVVIADEKPCRLMFLREFSNNLSPFAYLVTALGMLYTSGMSAEEKANNVFGFWLVMLVVLALMIVAAVIEFKRYGLDGRE